MTRQRKGTVRAALGSDKKGPTKGTLAAVSAQDTEPVRGGPRRLSPADRRGQLIDVAEGLFKSRAYGDIGVIDVAKAAGITVGLVYHYFESKEALFMAAYELRAQELLRFCELDPTLPFTEQVERGVRGYLDFVEAHGIAFLNLFRSAAASEPEFLRVCEQTRERIVDNFVSALGYGGDLEKPVALRLSLRGYLGYSESAVLQWLAKPTVTRETLQRLLLSAIIGAVRIGVASEREPPLSEEAAAELERHYRRHFGLP